MTAGIHLHFANAAYRVLTVLFLLLAATRSFAHGDETEEVYEAGAPGYDETSVFVNVQRVGGRELPALIRNGQVYLSVAGVFDFLKIKNTVSPGLDSVTGFFILQQAAFVVDKINNHLLYQGKTILLKPDDLIRTENDLFLKLDYFGQVFGLECQFDFRNLSVRINTDLDLPVLREMRQDQMRRNVSRIRGEIKADTSIGRSYPLFHAGMADWSVISMQEQNGHTDTRASLALGAVVAGGETNVAINYFSNASLELRQQFYQWRYADNDHSALRQVVLGKINPQASASLFAPVVGAQLTNAPTTFRRSFGTYVLSDKTNPGWVVELYVNNVLVDYVKADASGFYSFNVPMVYGNTVVRLRFYSPWGEEYSRVENVSIPFSFLPKRELEYTVSAGMVEDEQNSRYARAVAGYGVTRSLTVSTGVEYLSSVTSGPVMPFVNASLRVSSNLLLSGEHIHGVRSRGILGYRLPSGMQLELCYSRYEKDQKAVLFNGVEERKGSLSVPFRVKNVSLLSRLSLNQVVLPGRTSYTTGEWLVSASAGMFSANVSTNLTAIGLSDPVRFDPYLYSNASLAFRLPQGFLLLPQAQYAWNQKELISVKCGLEKMVFRKGFVNLTYEQNFKSRINSVGAGFRYDLSFARVGVSARKVNNDYVLVQSARGSLVRDGKTGYLGANNRSNVGRSGIAILAFLDMNCNGRRDAGEPKVPGLRVQVSGGRIEYSERDTLSRIFDLEPYTAYFVELSQSSFEQVSWQLRHKTMNIMADPNQVKLIEVPVAVMGEASGRVYLQGANGSRKGQGRIKVCFYRPDNTTAGCTITEADGYFSFLGLAPGKYIVRPDAAQMSQLKMNVVPEAIPVTIGSSRDGDVVDGLVLVLEVGK